MLVPVLTSNKKLELVHNYVENEKKLRNWNRLISNSCTFLFHFLFLVGRPQCVTLPQQADFHHLAWFVRFSFFHYDLIKICALCFYQDKIPQSDPQKVVGSPCVGQRWKESNFRYRRVLYLIKCVVFLKHADDVFLATRKLYILRYRFKKPNVIAFVAIFETGLPYPSGIFGLILS